MQRAIYNTSLKRLQKGARSPPVFAPPRGTTPAPGPDKLSQPRSSTPVSRSRWHQLPRRGGRTAGNSPRPASRGSPAPSALAACARPLGRDQARAAPRCTPFPPARPRPPPAPERKPPRAARTARMRSSSALVRAKRVAQAHARHGIPLGKGAQNQQVGMPRPARPAACAPAGSSRNSLKHSSTTSSVPQAAHRSKIRCKSSARGVVRPVGLFGSHKNR